MEKEVSRIGVYLAMITESLMVVNMVTIVQGIIQDDNLADARSVDPLDITPPQCTRPVKPKAKNAEWDDTAWQEDVEWQDYTWETEEYEASKGKKGKGKKSKPKGKLKGKGTPRSIAPRPAQSQTPRSDRPHPKAKPDARSCMADDFLFALMSTKSKPTWRHSTWNGTDYMICTVVEPQKKLPIFKLQCKTMVSVTSRSNCSLWT